MPFHLLHVSDMHFGPHCYYQWDDPKLVARRVADDVVSNLGRSFEPISAVILSGDFTWAGTRDEFQVAIEFIDELVGRLRIGRDRLIIIPGNHDIRWGVPASSDPAKVVFRPRAAAEDEYRRFFQAVTGRPPASLLSMVRTFDEGFVIAGLNSCRFEGPDHAGLGFVGADQLDEITEELAKVSARFRIAVLHHHLVPITDVALRQLLYPRARRSFSLTVDAASVLAGLLDQQFSMVLHGHMHTPHLSLETRPGDPSWRSLAIAASGSISVGPPHCRLNHFQVIEVTGTDVFVHGYEAPHTGPNGRGGWLRRTHQFLRSSVVQPGRPKPALSRIDRTFRMHAARAPESWLDAWMVLTGDAEHTGQLYAYLVRTFGPHTQQEHLLLRRLFDELLSRMRGNMESTLEEFAAELESDRRQHFYEYTFRRIRKAWGGGAQSRNG